MGLNDGTLQVIGRQLALALADLEQDLSGGLEYVLAELGLRLPVELARGNELTTATQAAVGAAGALGPLLDALAAAVASDDLVAVVTATTQLLDGLRGALSAVEALSASLHAVATTTTVLDAAQRAQLDAFASELPTRLLDHLLVRRLADAAPQALAALNLAGLLDHVVIDATPGDTMSMQHVRSELHLDRLGRMVSSPGDHLRDVYGWGEPTFDALGLLQRLQLVLLSTERVDAILLQPPGGQPALEAYLFAFQIDDTVVPPELVFSVRFPGTETFTKTYPLSPPWTIEVDAKGTFVEDLTGRVTPPFDVSLTPPSATSSVEAEVHAALVATAPAPDQPVVLLGLPGGTRLQASRVALQSGFAVTWDGASGRATGEPTLGLEMKDGALVVSLGGADGFLASVLPQSLQLDVNLDADWRPSTGLVFRGGAALVVTVPMNRHLGPAHLAQLDLGLAVDNTAVTLQATLTGDISLGPFVATAQGLGAAIALRFERGNLGPVDLAFRFVPPTGLGLAIDAGAISGGGFIRYEEAIGRYSGLFQVNVGSIGVGAVGLLDTRLPSGHGYALLVVLRATFPAIEVGFGFALTSVGGLLALNRSIDVDALRARMASGTIGRILAPEDPVRNAPALLADLAAVFPPTEGVIVVGPTLQLTWAELVRFDVGVFIELPGPRKIVVLGSARATLENPSGGKPYLQIRLDILGVLDLQKQTVAFDAVLVDSSLLEVLELTGGAAFRLSYGADPYVVLTVGGFHPAYSPSPLVFPSSLTRITMTRGTPDDTLYMRFEGYFAITTNTRQFGAAVEVIINLSPFDIRGTLSFDALIQLLPFHFSISIHASVKVRWKGHNLGGLDLSGELSGPGPVVFHGKVCFDILFCSICFEDTFTLGSSALPLVGVLLSAVDELLHQLDDPATLHASEDVDRYVALAPPSAGSEPPVVSPIGQLVWTQQRAPLELLLQKVGGSTLDHPETVHASGPHVSGPDQDWFAPGAFVELSDADALSRKAFERLQGGVRFGVAGVDDGPARTLPVTVKQIRIPAPPTVAGTFVLPAWFAQATVARTGGSAKVTAPPVLTLAAETWTVHGDDGTVLHADLSQAQAHQLAQHAPAAVAVAQGDLIPAIAF